VRFTVCRRIATLGRRYRVPLCSIRTAIVRGGSAGRHPTFPEGQRRKTTSRPSASACTGHAALFGNDGNRAASPGALFACSRHACFRRAGPRV